MRQEYIIPFKGDISSLMADIKKADAEIARLNENEIILKLLYDENIKDFNKKFENVLKTHPNIAIQFQYEVNKQELADKMKELKGAEVELDMSNAQKKLSDLSNSIQEVYKSWEDAITDDEIDKYEAQLTSLVQDMVNFQSVLEDIGDDGRRIYSSLSSETREIVKEIKNMYDISPNIDTRALEEQQEYISQIQNTLDMLRDKGAVDIGIGTKEANDIETAKTSLEKLMALYSGFVTTHQEKELRSFWVDLKEKIEDNDEEILALIEDLGLLDKTTKSINLVSEGLVKKGGIIGDESVLLSSIRGDKKIDELNDLKKKLDEAADAGINVARVLDIIYDKQSNSILEVQEKAVGTIMGSVYGSDNEFVNPEIYEATDEQIKKLISDILKLQDLGIGVDINTTNILYDKEKGFSLIDLNLDPAEYKDFEDFLDDFVKGTAGSIQEFYEIVGNTQMSDTVDMFEDRIRNIANVVKEANEAVLNSIKDTQDSVSLSKESRELGVDLGEGYALGIEEKIPRVSDAASHLAESALDALRDHGDDFTNLGVVSGQRYISGLNYSEPFITRNDIALSDTSDKELFHAGEEHFHDYAQGLTSSAENAGQIAQVMTGSVLEALREDDNVFYEVGANQGFEYDKGLSQGLKSAVQIRTSGEDSADIDIETNELGTLKSAIDAVTVSVNEKTQAFTQEKLAVETAVQGEIAQLEQLQSKLSDISEQTEGLSKIDTTKMSETKNKTSTKEKSELEKFSSKYAKLLDKYSKQWILLNNRANNIGTDNIRAEIAEIGEELNKLSKRKGTIITEADIESAKQFSKQLDDASQRLSSKEFREANKKTISNLNNELADYANKFRGLAPGVKEFQDRLKAVGNQQDLELLIVDINNFKAANKEAGREVKSFFDTIGNRLTDMNAKFIAQFLSWQDLLRYVRSAVEAVRELDTQLVDLRKTTTMTASELDEFYYASNDIAKQLGVTTAEIIQQASSWSRLNKIGLLYSNV